ncbi:MAG: helix-turn-helix transcriptional regulator [Proteobacteria bacterium]|nr:helix-turn-helix transcriptional regulator [Pseudomonadota bacterium]
MDESAVALGSVMEGVLAELARSSGAVARLTALPGGATLDDHVHDFPYLSLHVLGAYREHGEAGEVRIAGPCAAFHPAGSAHGDRIEAAGLTTVVIEFDPAWLDQALGESVAPGRSVYWRGGGLATQAQALARTCLQGEASDTLDQAARFIARAMHGGAQSPDPAWLDRLEALIGEEGVEQTAALAGRLGVTPAWLTRAYRDARGEGLADALRRRRVEAAIGLLERGGLGLAEVAADAGFCDQSHMNRVFRAVLGRTPAEAQAERMRLQ